MCNHTALIAKMRIAAFVIQSLRVATTGRVAVCKRTAGEGGMHISGRGRAFVNRLSGS